MKREQIQFIGAWAAIAAGLFLLPYQVGAVFVAAGVAALVWRHRRERT